MPKFAVHVHGTGCWFSIEDETSGELVQTAPRPMGFYTVRFVETRSVEEAIAQVVELIQAEVKSLYRDGYPRSIEVEEVIENPKRFDEFAPGGGFTWYPEEANETTGH